MFTGTSHINPKEHYNKRFSKISLCKDFSAGTTVFMAEDKRAIYSFNNITPAEDKHSSSSSDDHGAIPIALTDPKIGGTFKKDTLTGNYVFATTHDPFISVRTTQKKATIKKSWR